jgi:molecular chaperone Hsp33
MSDQQETHQPEGIKVLSFFCRKRNALFVQAAFEPLFVDYYLHLASRNIQYSREEDQLMKDALAAITLHCTSRPRNESSAWTIHLQNPLVNLFVTGDNSRGRIVGQIFLENVKEAPENLLYAKTVSENGPMRTSVVNFTENNLFRAVEHYYRQSEQRPARYFEHADEQFSMICAQPDCDMAWFESLDSTIVKNLQSQEELTLLETRYYKWECGCNLERIHEILVPTMKSDPQSLFENEETLRISCPRCGIKYVITREGLEAFISKHKKS